MIKIENVVLPSADQWNVIIMGTRNPLNSWAKSDSRYVTGSFRKSADPYNFSDETEIASYEIGPNDLDLMKRLANGGADDRKFMRMIVVYLDIVAPIYWWKQADQYKIGTVTNSCSTMHKIHAKEFTLDDFSHEHVLRDNSVTVNYVENDFRILNNLQ